MVYKLTIILLNLIFRKYWYYKKRYNHLHDNFEIISVFIIQSEKPLPPEWRSVILISAMSLYNPMLMDCLMAKSVFGGSNWVKISNNTTLETKSTRGLDTMSGVWSQRSSGVLRQILGLRKSCILSSFPLMRCMFVNSFGVHQLGFCHFGRNKRNMIFYVNNFFPSINHKSNKSVWTICSNNCNNSSVFDKVNEVKYFFKILLLVSTCEHNRG